MICSFLTMNDFDTFKLQWVDPALVRGFMMELVGDRKIAYALEEMMKILRRKLPSVDVEWERIAQCVDQKIQ